MVEEKLVTWTCKLCGEYEVRDIENKALGKLVKHLGEEHPKKYADILWKIANEMEPIKVSMPLVKTEGGDEPTEGQALGSEGADEGES